MKKGLMAALVVLLGVAATAGYFYQRAQNSTASILDERWVTHDANSTDVVDHSEWQFLLDDYLVTDTETGVHLFDYSGLLDDGREPLDDYIASVLDIDPLTLNRDEQMAYWLNVYNAVTVQLILDHYPVASITSLGSGGVTTFGPWDDKLLTVNGIDLSLNDVEHRIIRPLYQDYRIHFAVNCASIGCPDLATYAYTAEDLDEQLDASTRAFLNHPRGLSIDGDRLLLSSLFDWYGEDFGNTLPDVLDTLGKYTDDSVRTALANFSGTPTFAYDWALNGYCAEDNSCGE